VDMQNLKKEKLQLIRIVDQLYSMGENEASEAKESTELEEGGGGDREEDVRDKLRTATTKEELEVAISEAKALNMLFEASLGEKKLSKISQ
jgi:hypothetical protein